MDNGTVRMLIIAFVILVVFGSLIALIPSQFSANVKTYASPQEQIPNEWTGLEIGGFELNITESWNQTLTWDTQVVYFDVGGRNLGLSYSQITPAEIIMWHRYGAGLIYNEIMDWYDLTMTLVRTSGILADDLDEIYESKGLNGLTFKVNCAGEGVGLLGSSTKFFVYTMFDFNTTAYSDVTNAWYNNALDIFVGIDAENSNMQNDIWYLITALMTFNTLEIFGTTDTTARALNFIIASVVWAMAIIPSVLLIKELLSNWL